MSKDVILFKGKANWLGFSKQLRLFMESSLTGQVTVEATTCFLGVGIGMYTLTKDALLPWLFKHQFEHGVEDFGSAKFRVKESQIKNILTNRRWNAGEQPYEECANEDYAGAAGCTLDNFMHNHPGFLYVHKSHGGLGRYYICYVSYLMAKQTFVIDFEAFNNYKLRFRVECVGFQSAADLLYRLLQDTINDGEVYTLPGDKLSIDNHGGMQI